MTPEECLEIIKKTQSSEADAIRATTQLVLEAVRAAGALSLMPNPALPLTGILVMVHPKIYDAVRSQTKEARHAGDGTP